MTSARPHYRGRGNARRRDLQVNTACWSRESQLRTTGRRLGAGPSRVGWGCRQPACLGTYRLNTPTPPPSSTTEPDLNYGALGLVVVVVVRVVVVVAMAVIVVVVMVVRTLTGPFGGLSTARLPEIPAAA